MKEITETRSVTGYECEICGRKSGFDWEIKRCEEQHKCSHKEVYYWLDIQTAYDSFAGMPQPTCFIEKRCKTCGYSIDRQNLSMLDPDDEEIIYNLFEKPSLFKLDKNIVDINDPDKIPKTVMNKFWEIKEELGTTLLGISHLSNKGWYIICPSKEEYILWYEK